MKIRRWSDFLENATTGASSGMGDVSVSQPGSPPGTLGISGSGDVTFTFKKEKRKKGGPSQVTDMRDLAPAKGITKLKEISESKLDIEDKNMVEDCLQELVDLGFEITHLELDSQSEGFDVSDEGYVKFDSQELRISLYKQIKKVWRGNVNVRYLFNKDEIHTKRISTLRPDSKTGKLESDELQIVELAEDASNKLINILNWTSGQLDFQFSVSGSGMPWNERRNVNANIHIVLQRNLYK